MVGSYSSRMLALYTYLFTERVVSHCEDNDEGVSFEKVTIMAPSKKVETVFVRDLTFKVAEKQSLIISGPSGTGKSTIVKAIGRIWPYTEGKYSAPKINANDMMILSKEPYIIERDL